MFSFIWTLYGNAQIIGLSLSEFGEMNSDALQVQTGNLLVKMLGQTVYIDRILLVKELYLSQDDLSHNPGLPVGHRPEV